MQGNDDSLFDVVHSLPVLSYSVALAQRTPAAGSNQQTKYMPDYGGYLETTTSCLKNNSLASGIPFHLRPKRTRIKFVNPDERTITSANNCLIVTPYLESGAADDLSVIRLLGPKITFNSLRRVPREQHETIEYDHISLKKRDSTGLKHVQARDNYLLVRFTKSVKAYKLNCTLDCGELSNGEDSQSAHQRVATIKDRTGYLIKDVSLNPNSNNLLGLASDNSNVHSIKLFDLSVSSKQPFQNVEWATVGNEFPSVDTCLLSKELRGRVVRTFIPMRPTNWGTQQLDHVPSHLFNLLVTNEHRISLVDPRSCSLAQNYLMKSELPSFYPIEYLRRTVFSTKNSYQFYSMTNVHVRVIDTRYPGVPVGQVGHMLESETYNSMDMKLIEYPDCDSETICCSSMSRLCFITFNQNKFGFLINPKSDHLPYHDTSLNENHPEGDLPSYGLSAICSRPSKQNDELFSVFQLSSKGDLLIRSYTRADSSYLEPYSAEMDLISEVDQARPIEDSTSSVPIHQAHELPDRDTSESQAPSCPEDVIDMLDSSFLGEIENRLESKRAQEKYEIMKNKLRRV